MEKQGEGASEGGAMCVFFKLNFWEQAGPVSAFSEDTQGFS